MTCLVIFEKAQAPLLFVPRQQGVEMLAQTTVADDGICDLEQIGCDIMITIRYFFKHTCLYNKESQK